MKRRTFNSLMIASAAAMAAGIGAGGAQAAELTRITVGTNPAGTLDNTMGAAFAMIGSTAGSATSSGSASVCSAKRTASASVDDAVTAMPRISNAVGHAIDP